MNAIGQWLRYCNRQVSKFTVFDLKAVQVCGILTGIFLAKLAPSLLELSIWLLAMILLLAARPLYVFFASTDRHRSGAAGAP
jgi:hypothetical protein